MSSPRSNSASPPSPPQLLSSPPSAQLTLWFSSKFWPPHLPKGTKHLQWVSKKEHSLRSGGFSGVPRRVVPVTWAWRQGRGLPLPSSGSARARSTARGRDAGGLPYRRRDQQAFRREPPPSGSPPLPPSGAKQSSVARCSWANGNGCLPVTGIPPFSFARHWKIVPAPAQGLQRPRAQNTRNKGIRTGIP